MRRPNKARPGRRGAAILEFAAVATVFFLLLFAIYEFGRLMMMRHLLDNAAREAARQAVVNTEEMKTADVEKVAKTYLAGQALNNVKIQVFKADPATGKNLGSWTDAGIGESIGVQLDAEYQAMLPTMKILPSTVKMSTTAIMFCEGN